MTEIGSNLVSLVKTEKISRNGKYDKSIVA
jgi:hypothetical protein